MTDLNARWIRTLKAIAAAAVVALTLALTACSATDGSDLDACLSAFRNAQPRAGAPNQASPLDDAVRACTSLADWRAAWDRVPDAHRPDQDPLEFLRSRCGLEILAPTTLCREVAAGS
jgi:hypothetical protein